MRLNVLLCAILATTCSTIAHAQLTLSFDVPAQVILPGSTTAFAGTLLNGSTTVFLNGASFTLGSADLTLDASPFINNAPASLLPGQSWSGDLFTLSVAPGAQQASIFNTFTITGGNAPNDQNDLVTSPFVVTVVPEPGSAILLTGALASGGLFYMRRVRRPRA